MKDIKIQIGYEICKILTENKIKNFIDFGTLLGFYRDKKIIDNDYDFDIFAYFDKDFNFDEKFANLISKYNLTFDTRKNGKNLLLIYENFTFEIYQIAINKKRFHPLYAEKFDLPTFFIDELDKITIDDLEFNTPRHLSSYLTHRYGKYYLEPKKFAPNGKHWYEIDYNIVPAKQSYTAYTYGVYDLFHVGHVNLFKNIKKHFNKLIVGVHNDDQVLTYKNKPVIPYSERLEIIKSIKYVDEIVENAPLVITNDILNSYDADYVATGREDNSYINKYYKVSEEKLHLIKRTENISSSLIKEKILIK